MALLWARRTKLTGSNHRENQLKGKVTTGPASEAEVGSGRLLQESREPVSTPWSLLQPRALPLQQSWAS